MRRSLWRALPADLLPPQAREAIPALQDAVRAFSERQASSLGRCATSFAVHDPASGHRIASVGCTSASQAEAAVDRSADAQAEWRGASCKARSALLRDWCDLCRGAYRERLAQCIALESGKPYAEAQGETDYALAFIEFFAEEAKRVNGDILPAPSNDRSVLVHREPVGVTCAITPWNFPAAMITRKVAPALAVGCSSIVKPSEETPLTAVLLAEAAREAGLPDGLLQVLPSDRAGSLAIGDALCEDGRVRKLSFTGSTAAGKALYARCAGTVKRLSLELGGNAPFIVFRDADVEAAVGGLMASKFRNAGQTCVCTNRVLVHRAVHDAFVDALRRRVAALRVGHGMAEGTTIGPLISAAQKEKVSAMVRAAERAGAEAVDGGAGGAALREETFFMPTIVTNASADMDLWRREIFGPVVPIAAFDSDEEAVALANATSSGLAAYFYTADLRRAHRVSAALEYGMVGVNEGIISTELAPFGGVKESGIGREGSVHGKDEYLETKYVCIGGLA